MKTAIFKIFFIVFFTLIFILVGGVILTKDYILKNILELKARNYLGINLKIDELRTSLLNSTIEIKGLKLYNPENFPKGTLAKLPEIFIDFYPLELFFGKIHLKNVNIDLESLSIIRNASGQLNLGRFSKVNFMRSFIRKRRTDVKNEIEEYENDAFLIDKLVLSIGKVTYEEYDGKDRLKYQEFNIGIKNRTFKNVTDFNQVLSLLIPKILKNKIPGDIKTNLGWIIEEKLESPADIIKESLEDLKILLS